MVSLLPCILGRPIDYRKLLSDIGEVHASTQKAAARAVNRILTARNWLIGAYIFEYEQNGDDRAAYGTQLLESLATDLKRQNLDGFSLSNLKNYRQLALVYPALALPEVFSHLLPQQDGAQLPGSIRQPLISELAGTPAEALVNFPVLLARASAPELPWQDQRYFRHLFGTLSYTHLLRLSRLEEPLKRAFYELECMKAGWSRRELDRQLDSMLFERVGLSKDKEAVLTLAQEGRLTDTPEALLRDPYVLEFLGIEQRVTYDESELEQALIDHLEAFMRELGRDFCFVGRQQRMTVGGTHYRIDLLFFQRRLRCLVAVDLKLGEFKHEYAGQMNFYLSYLKAEEMYEGENPPVGIVLCTQKDDTIVCYATAGMDNQLFVSRYQVFLPTEEQLRQWLMRERQFLEQALESR